MSHADGPSQRQLRVGEQLRQIISEVLRRGKFNDPLLLDAGYTITISEVRPSPDLRQARVFMMPLGGGRIDELLEALNRSSPYFSKELGKRLSMKFTPKLKFLEDQSFGEAQHIEELLRGLPQGTDEADGEDT